MIETNKFGAILLTNHKFVYEYLLACVYEYVGVCAFLTVDVTWEAVTTLHPGSSHRGTQGDMFQGQPIAHSREELAQWLRQPYHCWQTAGLFNMSHLPHKALSIYHAMSALTIVGQMGL